MGEERNSVSLSKIKTQQTIKESRAARSWNNNEYWSNTLEDHLKFEIRKDLTIKESREFNAENF